MKNKRACSFLVILSVLALSCTNLNLSGGNGSETTNGFVVGRLVEDDGSPAMRTRVMLVASNHDPVKGGPVPDFPTDTTDESGAFRLHVTSRGEFNIEAFQPGSGNRALFFGVLVNQNDTVYVPDQTIKKPGAIQLLLSSAGAPFNGYAYLPGTTHFTGINGGNGIIDSVPAGLIPSIVYADRADPARDRIVAAGITVSPGDTAIIAKSSVWKYSKRLYLNTTATGAGVWGTITNFPVLIRLTPDKFDFSRARADGGDLRFIKANGSPLPFEIERWDAVGQRAEIWVEVDTVYGNDSMQSITMYWGNSLAANNSNGAAVFDTASGFAAVWHLGETDSLAPDATGNHYDGAGYSTSPIAGMIGNAQHFNGNSSVIRMKGTASSRLSFPMNGHYTLSAWVYHDALADSVTYLVAGKGERQYFIKNFDLELSTAQHERQWEFTEYHENDWQSAAFVPATAGSWVHLVGVRDGSNEYLYVNGILAMNKIFAANQGQFSQDTSDDFAIGGFLRPVTTYNQGYAYFSGVIDEVTVSSTPRSADWVKLNYMNQKEKDMLVRW